jgi:predicted nuclease with TOPRIM domain
VQQQLDERLGALRTEFESDQAALQKLETQAAFLRERLLMLKGAIQVLEQLRAELEEDTSEPDSVVREERSA